MPIIGYILPTSGKGTRRMYMEMISGPASYPAGGFKVDTNMRKIEYVNAVELGGGEYLSKIASVDGGIIKILVRNNIEQAVNEGGTATYTIGGEIGAATDLSGIKFQIIAIGS